MRAGQGGSRLNGNVRGLALAAGTDRDDDRFWKAGLLTKGIVTPGNGVTIVIRFPRECDHPRGDQAVNRDDPAVMVGARFGVGWTLNVGNPVAWLIIAGIVAMPAGLAAIGAAAGM